MNSRKLSLLLSILLPTLSTSGLWAGNPIGLVPQTIPAMERQGRPLVWKGPAIPYWPDRGSLGMLPNRTARNLLSQMFRVWDDQSTLIGFLEQDSINVDVDGRNFLDYINKRDGISPVIFDNNREILRALGLPKEILSISGPEFLDPKTGYVTEGIIIINTNPWNGDRNDENAELSEEFLQALLVHAIGHFIGLGHSQVNGDAFETQRAIQGFGVPPEDTVETMYPVLLLSQRTLETDDIVTLNWLYSGSTYFNDYATIRGRVLEPDSSRGAQGVNVVARNVDPFDPLAAFKYAVSQISGVLHDPDIPGTEANRGVYELPGLKAMAPYRLEVEPLGKWFRSDMTVSRDSTLRSTLVPRDQLQIIREFYNGPNESNMNPPDDPLEATDLSLPRGEIRPADFILNVPLYLTEIQPPSVQTHSDALISIRGSGFTPGSVVNMALGNEFVGSFNAAYQNPNEVQLRLPPEARVGKLIVRVVRPPGGRGNETVNALILDVTPAPMALSSVDPARVLYNSNEVVTIGGTNFYRDMWVRLKHATAGYEVEEKATYLSPTRATFRVSAAAPPSRYNLRLVRYPANLQENSTPEVPFEVLDNPLRISEITPPEAYSGSGAPITLRGTGFTNHSIVRFSSVPSGPSYQVTPPSFSSTTELSFALPAALTPGRYNVTVVRPPGDAVNVSNSVGFVVLVPPTTTTTTTTTTSTEVTTTTLLPTTTTEPPPTTTLFPTTTTLPPTTTTLFPTTTILPPTSSTSTLPTTTTIGSTTTTLFNPPPFGMIETPQQGATVQGIIPVSGWAVDDNGEVRVTLLVDSVPDGSQVAHLPRPDVGAVFPQYPNSANSGFRIELDTRTLQDRFHQITVTFQDRLGATSSPQTILIFVLNNP